MRISKEARAGFVVLTTLITFYALYNFLKGKNLFYQGSTYYVEFTDVNGLVPSKPVKINGFRVGSVDNIKLIDNEGESIHFLVTLKLDQKVKFSKNTIAEIHEPGMMSGSEVRLLISYDGEEAESGDRLKGQIKTSMFDTAASQLELVSVRLDSTMIDVQLTLGNINKILDDENRQSIKKILKDMDETMLSFNETSKSLTRTSDNANQILTENKAQIASTLNSTQETIEKFGEVAGKLNNLELEKIIEDFQTVSLKLNNILDDINDGKGTLGALVNDKELYENLVDTSNSLNELLLDLKENPKKYVQFSIFGKKE